MLHSFSTGTNSVIAEILGVIIYVALLVVIVRAVIRLIYSASGIFSSILCWLFPGSFNGGGVEMPSMISLHV